ncbi:MAG TPA: LON peptidase substrate-binding domain-containing protein [Thermomonas sp.]|nr:LON peptidase substrate-binding domain-containing protein [Thermomonas sp.]
MPDTDASLPLFPLHGVLVPGAALDLRIFERRYLDMVGECGRKGSGFGVCLILAGNEAGAPATPVAFGTEAVIEDFGNTPEGLLSLRVRGRRRFHVVRTRVRDTGLVVADIEYLADAASTPRLRPEHALLADLLRRILLQVDAGFDPDPALFEDAAWVGWRLAEVLPLSMPQRQVLLQLDDPHGRLQTLLDGIADADADAD